MATAVRTLLVKQQTWEAADVMSLRLVDVAGGPLPEWQPGAHLDLVLPSGKVRQYSLCGDPSDRRSYVVAVLHEPQGRGGSREVHGSPLVGRTVDVRGPRNQFELVPAPSYVFLAGGIGITPILAMVREVSRRGLRWKLYYGGRSRGSMAFVDELLGLDGGHVELVPQDRDGVLDIATILSGTPDDAAVYCCGPEGMIAAVEGECATRGRSATLNVERFGAVALTGGSSFEVHLNRSGVTLEVPDDRTVLDVVREAVPDVLYSCEQGFCGTCETTVLDGQPEHNDTVLNQQERERSATMMICVGRSMSARLVLDL